MLKIGYHLAVQVNNFSKCFEEAVSLGASSFAFFLGNPFRNNANSFFISKEEYDKINFIKKTNYFDKIIAHSPFIINLCSSKENIRNFSVEILEKEFNSVINIENTYYNIHPGNHTGQGIALGLKQIIENISKILNSIVKKNKNLSEFRLLFETMSGKGSEIGSKFEEIKILIEEINKNLEKPYRNILGVCLDTCHSHDAGYDFSELNKVLLEFDRFIGLDKLYVVHLNDSKNKCGSKKDRHEILGKGYLGFETIKKIVNNEELKDKIFILETPNDLSGYEKEIKYIKSVYLK